jgi:hypothetical protein
VPFPIHTRVTFSGYFGPESNPYEQWSFRINGDLGGNGAPLEDALIAARQAYSDHLRPLIRPHAVLQEVKWAHIDELGTYTQDPVIHDVGPGGIPGEGLDGDVMPPQCSLAVSLNTATRGAKGRGRMFLPAPAAQISSADGLMTAARAQLFAQGAAGFLVALRQAGVIGFPSIVSSSGTRSTITSVRVGRAVDTIRSRRRSLVEGYGADVPV